MAVKSLSNMVVLVSLFFLLTSQAQNNTNDLISLAPADALVALSIDSKNFSADSLMEDLKALDWERADATLQKLVTLAEETGILEELLYEIDGDAIEIYDGIRGFLDGEGPAYDEMVDSCPALAEADMTEFKAFGDEAVLTVAFGGIGPAITAITRLSTDQASTAFEIQQAILDCARADAGEDSVTTLDEDGISLYVVGDGGDMPVIIGSNNGVFFLSSDPNSARAVARLSNGSGEESLADSALFANASGKISDDGIRYAVDFAGIADIVSGFRDLVVEGDPALSILFDRALAVLRTLGTSAGSISQSNEGLLSQSVLSANPDGGDPQLAKLMLCTDCSVSVPELAPIDSVAVSSQHLSIAEFLDYLQTWVDGLEDMIGPMNVQEFLAATFGVDLDVLLFDWLGKEIHTITMEVPSQKLSTLVYQPAQAIILPIDSVEAAEEAAQNFQDLWPMVRSMMDMIPQDEFSVDTLAYIATSEEAYNGVDYTRYRMSVNTDVAVTYLANNLVVASPSYAIEKIIDVSLGNIENITANPDYGTIVSSSIGTPMRGYIDAPVFWSSFAELVGLFSQPAAFLAKTALDGSMLITDEFGIDGEVFDSTTSFFDEDLDTISAQELELTSLSSTTLSETLAPTEADSSENTTSAFYLVDGVEAGSIITATLNSTDFDTYMRLIREGENGAEVILDNDDYAGSYEQSQLSFLVEEGADYLIEATSYGSDAGGNYSISISTGEDISEDFEFFEAYGTEYVGVPQLLSNGSSTDGQLAVNDASVLANYYKLPALNAGDEITVSIESESFDTYIYVIDATNGQYVAENDDFEGSYSLSSVNFIAEEGIEYLVKATSFDGFGTGSYELVLQGPDNSPDNSPDVTIGLANTDDQDVDVVERLSPEELQALAPSFSDLLHLTELLPEAMHVIANHLDYGEGYSKVSDTEIYRHSLYRVDW